MKKWPWYGYLLVAALIFALVFFFFFKPRNEDLQRLRAEREKLEVEVKDLKAKKQQLDQIEAEITAMNQTLKEIETIIPQKKEISDILRKIQQLAFDARLNIMKFNPSGEIKKEFYAEWPIPIEITGNYSNLGTFFDQLSHYSRIFNVDAFAIKALRTQTESLTLTSNFTAKTYYFIEEPPPAPAPQTKTRK